jgi:hypothetical protein
MAIYPLKIYVISLVDISRNKNVVAEWKSSLDVVMIAVINQYR